MVYKLVNRLEIVSVTIVVNMHCFNTWHRFLTPDHLCFEQTNCDKINGPGGTIYIVIIDSAGPLMYPDQISRYSCFILVLAQEM